MSKLSISDSLTAADWEQLAYALKKVSCGVEGDDPGAKRLRARLGMIRMLMYDEISTWNGNSSIDLSFFVASFKTIRSVQKEYDSRGIKKREFLIFLKLLFDKFQKQRLKVNKRMDTQAEFGRMKGVVENGRSPL